MISVSAYLLKGGWPKNLMTLRIPSEYVKTYIVLRDSVAATVGIGILDAQKRSSGAGLISDFGRRRTTGVERVKELSKGCDRTVFHLLDRHILVVMERSGAILRWYHNGRRFEVSEEREKAFQILRNN